MKARDLVGKTFHVVGTEEDKYSLTYILRDRDDGTEHRLKVSEEQGVGADHGWYYWTEVHFDGNRLFKT